MLKELDPATRAQVWLKLDSGMNRLGFKGDAFREAHAAVCALPASGGIVNLMTHLSSADSPELPTTAEQLMVFGAASRSLPGERSLASSAAILKFPESHADWVRPGIMLYGISPFPRASGAEHGLRPVMTLSSRVIAVKDVAEGEQVGYGGDWTATRPTRLAIASIGYGDGYPRSAASGTPALVNGEMASLAGRVSMDMLAIVMSRRFALKPVQVAAATPWCCGAKDLPLRKSRCGQRQLPTHCPAASLPRVAVTVRE